jgi:hypothetical protein
LCHLFPGKDNSKNLSYDALQILQENIWCMGFQSGWAMPSHKVEVLWLYDTLSTPITRVQGQPTLNAKLFRSHSEDKRPVLYQVQPVTFKLSQYYCLCYWSLFIYIIIEKLCYGWPSKSQDVARQSWESVAAAPSLTIITINRLHASSHKLLWWLLVLRNKS